MEYRNLTPFPSLVYEAIDAQSQSFEVAVLRMTLSVEPNGTLKIADDQAPLVMVDELYGELNKSSVKQESDLAPYKPWCDVIVVGDALAPGGKWASRFESGIRISRKGNTIVHKRITVTGPRYWKKRWLGGWRLTKPDPIQSLPLRYEYAYGGECRVEANDSAVQRIKAKHLLTPDQRKQHPEGSEKAPVAHTCCETNPIGMGYTDSWYLRAMKINKFPAPQIESPNDPIKKFRKPYDPQGLGVIGRAWESRSNLCGTMDDHFVRSDRALPEDFDFAYWNGAHPDLQTPWLHGDETIDLINIPISNFRSDRLDSHGNRITRLFLPGHHMCEVATMEDGKISSRDFHIDTLIIDAEKRVVSLVYRLRLLKQLRVKRLEATMLNDEGKAVLDLHCQEVTKRIQETNEPMEATHG